MSTKTEKFKTLDCFKEYKAFAGKHTSNTLQSAHVREYHSPTSKPQKQLLLLKGLRSDNGAEYLSSIFKSFLASHGMQHQLTDAYNWEQNGTAERVSRALLNPTRSMLHHRSLPKHFWAAALSKATYVPNRVICYFFPASAAPYHRWHGVAPDVSQLRVLGAPCWYVSSEHEMGKLDPGSRPAPMMGFTSQSSAYKL